MGVTLDTLTQETLGRIVDKRLGPMITELRSNPRSAIDDIKATPKEYKALIEMVGIAGLHVLGHHPTVSTHARNKKYRPLLKKYGALNVGDLLW